MLQRHSAWATAGTLPTVCKIRNYSSGVGGGGGELVDWEKGVWIHFKSTKALFFEKLKCPKSISVRADDFASFGTSNSTVSLVTAIKSF